MQFFTIDECATGKSPQVYQALYNMLNEVLLNDSDTVVRNAEGSFARLVSSLLLAVMTRCVELQQHAAALIQRYTPLSMLHSHCNIACMIPINGTIYWRIGPMDDCA